MGRLHSFRLRIALLSAALAGTTLAGFSMVSWQMIYGAHVNRLDAKLENQVVRGARPRSPEQWRSIEGTLPQELGASSNTPLGVWVMGEPNEMLYQSEQWPAELNVRPLLPPRPPRRNPFPFEAPPPFPRPDRPSERSRHRPNRISEGGLPDPRIVTLRTSTGSWRVGMVSFSHSQVAIAISLAAIDQEMAVIRNIFLVAIPGVLLLITGGAWLISGSALRPIQQLTATIHQVTIKGLDQRVPVGATDVEFAQLIQVFNQMLEHLERSFKQASRFSGDAAHELKTPLAILQGELERTMQQVEPGSDLQQNLSNLLDEVRRLSGIVRKLLLLSLADAGQMNLYKIEVNVSELLLIIAEDVDLLAPHLTVQAEITPDLRVWGDRDLLMQLLQNLLSNAIKYNVPDGWLRVQGRQHNNRVQVTLTNASNDISLKERDRIFDRFYRGDPARTRKVEGIGLGLSLSREIARAHQGDLVLDDTPTGQTAFTLVLPRYSNTPVG